MKKLLSVILIIFLFSCEKDDPNEKDDAINWEKTFGGSNSDYFCSVQQTTDGGYILAGYTESFGAGNKDGWLIKTDENGNEQWSQTFGGPDSDFINSVQQTRDGGYILAGDTAFFTAGNYYNEDGWLIKTDETGIKQWSQTFGGSNSDYINSVQQTTDGGYILAGNTQSSRTDKHDGWLIKTDENGNEKWSQTFGGSDYDRINSAEQTTDGGYILAGRTISFGDNGWLIKTDENGNEKWSHTFGGSEYDGINSVQQTTDGGYILAGYTGSFGDNNLYGDGWLIKTDENGNEQWSQTFGGSNADYIFSIQQTTDGGYILAGMFRSFGAGNYYNGWLIKTVEKNSIKE